ncbi:MAG: amidohydrolase [Candidatus Hydrogenedentes bacterium]|nr:amidohydrolase [Candidatus Hydrogenedentota bacterium]
MEIWDAHAHLTGLSGRTPDERMAFLIRLTDRMGVSRVCVSMGMSFEYDPTPERFRSDNDEVLQALSHWHHRAFGFAYVNPKYPEDSVSELNRCVAGGLLVGVKLWVAERCNLPGTDTIVELATELKAPVYQHTWLKATGNLPGESTPMDLADLAARHPDAAFICGHTGGDWEQGLRAIRPRENVYVDLSGTDPVAGFTEMAVRELGAERVLFGSDAGGRSYSTQLAKVQGARISDSDKQLILKENFRRVLSPILALKGISN